MSSTDRSARHAARQETAAMNQQIEEARQRIEASKKNLKEIQLEKKDVREQTELQEEIRKGVLECPICTENYNSVDRIPRFFEKCGHTAYTHCFSCQVTTKDKEINERRLKKKNVFDLPCPMCRKIKRVMSDFDEQFPINEEVLVFAQASAK
uniref:RING-type domain-containing protein n=1 Tax=Caenorhabditis tropicalis TaxID=1561998 RepID=A0A1I7TRI8_9PELO